MFDFRSAILASSLLLSLPLLGCDRFLAAEDSKGEPVVRERNQTSARVEAVEHQTIAADEVAELLTRLKDALIAGKPEDLAPLYAERITGQTVYDGQSQKFDLKSWLSATPAQRRLDAAIAESSSEAFAQLQKARAEGTGLPSLVGLTNLELALTSFSAIARFDFVALDAEKKATKQKLAHLYVVMAKPDKYLKIASETWSAPPTPRAAAEDEIEIIAGTDAELEVDADAELELADVELASTTLTTGLDAFDPQEFAFVAERKNGLALLVGSVPEEAVSPLNPVYISDTAAERAVFEKKLPESIQKLNKKIYRVYNERGLSCIAQVDGFVALAEVQPHFAQLENWKGAKLANYVNQERRALDLWELSKMGGRYLAATLKTDEDCPGAYFAQASDWPQPTLWKSRGAEPAEERVILEFARIAPEYRKLQKEFQSAYTSSAYWDSTGASGRELRIFEGPEGEEYVSLLLRAGLDDSCAAPFDPDLWLLLRKVGPMNYEVVSAEMAEQSGSLWPRYLRPLNAEMAFDINGDGQPEFVGGYDFFRSFGMGVQSVLNVAPAYFSSPC